MNDDVAAKVALIICGTILIVLCLGTPDLLDAITHLVEKAAVCR